MSNCKLQALYFATVKAEVLDEFEGEKGVFIKSFLINDKTNLNDWEVTKLANVKDGPNFKGMPGIEFFNKGRRDHTVGESYEDALRLQSPHAKGIIRKVIDMTGGVKLEQVTRMFDGIMIEKIRKAKAEGKDIFVSPAIFPRSIDDVDIIDMPDGSHIHRVNRYLPLHYAFVDEPAYGDEAKVTDICEGNDCLIKLAKISATEGIGQDGIEPIRTIPIIRVSRCTKTGKIKVTSKEGANLDDLVSENLTNKLGSDKEPTNEEIAIAFTESRKKLKSFNSQIQQSKKYSKLSVEETEKEKKMEARLVALEDDKKDREEEAKKAKAKKAKEDGLHENNNEEKLTAAEQEEKDKEDKAKKSKKAKEGNEDVTKEKKEETAKIASMQKVIDAEIKMPKIATYLKYRASVGDSEEILEVKKAKLMKGSIEDINDKLEEVAPHIAAMQFNTDAESPKPETEFPMMGMPGQMSGSTTKKSGSELYAELYGE